MLIVYFGADAGCGCTMIAQSNANYIASQNSKKRVLLLSLSGYSGIDYANMQFNYSLDDLQVKLKSNVLTIEELECMCTIRRNLYMLQGSRNLKSRKNFMPEEIIKLIEIAEKHFEYIIADAGSSVDLGIGLGALTYGGKNVLVVTQSQKAFSRYMQKKSLLDTLEISFNEMVINKFVSRHFLPSEKLIKDSYKIDNYSVIEYSDYGMQAENEGNSIDSLDKAYKKQVEEHLQKIFSICRVNNSFNEKQKKISFLSRLRGSNG